MQLNEIIKIKDYNLACDFANENNYTIKEIEKDEKGERQFKIVEIQAPSETEKLQIEMNELKSWFNTYYTEHEQKYRRLYSLKINCDDGTDPYLQLMALYQKAEQNRKRIQELESQYGIE